jgi:glycosyltransferase involved in cell wall biosynthesis
MKLSIIIPTYNEEKTIGAVIDKIKNLKLNVEKEIIVIDDGSTDNSYAVIKSKKGIKAIQHEKNKGKGGAIKTGIRHMTGDLFIIQDADLELDPNNIERVITPIISGNAKVVYGSRMPKIGKMDRHPLFFIGGIIVTFFTNLLYGTKLTDEPCGYKAFKLEDIKNIKTRENGFGWEPEITAKLSREGIKIDEVEIFGTNSRSAKEGKKLRAIDGIKAIWILIKYRF